MTPRMGSVILWVVVSAILLFVLAPILVTIAVSFTTAPYLAFPPVGFTWEWYDRAIETREFIDSLILSFKIGVLATIGSIVFGTTAALGLARGSFPGKSALLAILLSPLVFPMLVTGIAFLQFFNSLRFGAVFWQLVIAHIVVTMPYVVRTVTASLQMIDERLESSARVLGAGPFEAMFKVTLPLAANGIVAGGIFAFVTSFDNFPVSMWLVNAEYRTLPLTLFALIDRFLDPSIAAISSLTIALSLVLAILVERLVGLRRFASI
ncbi:MAG: ABC transporter permease [Pseudolabrys sp.]|jgi:putative spermidine/putrescine transport system permease protein